MEEEIVDKFNKTIKKLADKPYYVSDKQLSEDAALSVLLDCIRRTMSETSETNPPIKLDRE